ncbi:hypothetical protein LUZ63_018986 [Rhynchospora breviuscula]|uniref:Ionotropic glutamate receptor C-terminal domain-containing protein n=1 Tax=Rhynchospora breviuscula TaxID=2022672 RepID=A0A9Q0HIF4_9POAL|nr:hypothetical protein LUZ63_018986 [Rhynchospora breviuscula]
MQGLIGIRSYINETAPEYVNFNTTFWQRFKADYEKSGESSFDPGVYAVRAYDIVDAISLAATESNKNNRTLAENLMASNFAGLSGVIRLSNGSLYESERYSTFQLINVFGRSYRGMGIWVDGIGFYENEDDFMLLQQSSEKLESVVFWPGGLHKCPAGLRRLKNVDIVVGDVTILADRSENVSFTKPYMSSGLAMLVPVEVDRKGWLPTKAFSLALWMCVLALLLWYIILNLRPDVDTLKIGCDGNSFVPKYLVSVLNYSLNNIVEIYSASDYKKAFENGTITAAYLEVPYLRVFLSQNDNYTVNGEIQMLGVIKKQLPYIVIMSEQYSYLTQLSFE